MNPPTVLLMLKAPVEGEVKTRLGREIGSAAATCAYRRLVEHQLRQIPAQWRVHICYAPTSALASMRQWLGAELSYSAQAAGDLGARLTHATGEHFQRSSGPLIVLGGDCPYLDAARLLEAAIALEHVEAVTVPALDGGYCLIGLNRAEPHLFQAVPWSTAAVMETTRERLRERGVTSRELAATEDVDDRASWERALQSFPDLDSPAQ